MMALCAGFVFMPNSFVFCVGQVLLAAAAIFADKKYI
jgi:hypothetical protein